jgi:hypothetical protein
MPRIVALARILRFLALSADIDFCAAHADPKRTLRSP